MCGIYGAISNGGTINKKVIAALGVGSVVRGSDATGVAYIDKAQGFRYNKAAVPSIKYPFAKGLGDEMTVCIGHTRATTHGSADNNENNHPFISTFGKFALVHNGIVYNYRDVQDNHQFDYSGIDTDSYVFAQLLDEYIAKRGRGYVNMKAVREAAEELSGSFAVPILTSTGDLFMVRHTSPVVWCITPEAMYFASTENILKEGLRMAKMSPKNGLIVEQPENTIFHVNLAKGILTNCSFTPKKSSIVTEWDGWDYRGVGAYGGYKYDGSARRRERPLYSSVNEPQVNRGRFLTEEEKQYLLEGTTNSNK